MGCYNAKCENYVKMRLSPYGTGLYFVPDFYFIRIGNTLLNLNINTITDPQLYVPALKLLRSGSNLNKRFFSFWIKLYQGLFKGQDIIRPIQNNGGIGTKAGPDKDRVALFQSSFDLKLYGTVFRDPFWCNIIQNGIKNYIFQGTYRYFQRQVLLDLAYFRF